MPLVVIFHVSAGFTVLTSALLALIFRKGDGVHRAAGMAFVFAMMTIGATGFFMFEARMSLVNCILAFYFPLTAWTTVRRQKPGLVDIVLLLVGASAAGVLLLTGVATANSPEGSFEGFPAPLYFIFGGVAAWAALLDVKVLVQRGISGPSRIARHLWRMCYALFMACGAFFLGQQDFFPESFRGSPVFYALALAPIALLVFWQVYVRLAKRFAAAAA
jgi:uncharacterized membrane protein